VPDLAWSVTLRLPTSSVRIFQNFQRGFRLVPNLPSPADEERSLGTFATIVFSFKLVQICVGGRVAQRTTHGNDLTFVMKGMRRHMMEDKCWGADGDVPIGEM
jgi:hypothetical protein